MKFHFLRSAFLLLALLTSQLSTAQKGARIAYIDMDEILENIDDYKKGNLLLAKKIADWKDEIELKKMELKNLEDQLQAEKILLTPELVEDRESELSIFRNEIITLQNSYFGPQGSYIQQKNNLLKPIQDQVLSVVRIIAQERKYDFVFDRSSDLIMLYSAKNYDISGLVLKRINAAERIKDRKKQIEERKAAIKQRKKN